MKNRLEVAREMLRDDGVIVIHCDWIEDNYLKVILDEIFGRNNYVNNIAIRDSHPSGLKLSAKTKWSVFNELNNTGINVSIWKNKGKLHNKIFVVDNSTWIVGSYNPTNNGNKKNDENLIILKP